MPISTFADLKVAVASSLARSDVPSHVYALAHQEVTTRLRVREMEITAVVPVTAGEIYTDLPSGFLVMRHAYIGGDGTEEGDGGFSDGFSDGFEITVAFGADVYRRLEQTSGFNQSTEWDDSGTPATFSIQNGKIRWNPMPDADRSAVIHYVARPDEMTEDTDANTLLTTFPSLYLYSACRHAAVWAQDIDLAQVYTAAYESEAMRITKQDRVTRYSGPLASRRG
jgi:hypothetical protein